MNLSDLISPEYLAEQKRLHAAPRGYGGKGKRWADMVAQIAQRYDAADVLDYGAGQGSLGEVLNEAGFKTRNYDPAVDEFSGLPDPADMVVCTDVMEHVESDKIDAVVQHLADLALKYMFVVISIVPTEKTLSDGRSAHISLYTDDWWRDAFLKRFVLIEQFNYKPEKQWCALLGSTACASSRNARDAIS